MSGPIKIERLVQAAVIFATAMLGAASGSLFNPEWPAIVTAGVVALAVMGWLAHQRNA
jgi:hypothetical protein